VKTNIVALGITAAVTFNNCSGSEDPANQVDSIAAWAQAAGKATGIVTTTTELKNLRNQIKDNKVRCSL